MFYLIEISNGNEKNDVKAIYQYDTENEAVAMFHSKLGSAMKSEMFESELVMVIDENGKVIKRERYVNPVLSQPEPEPEAES